MHAQKTHIEIIYLFKFKIIFNKLFYHIHTYVVHTYYILIRVPYALIANFYLNKRVIERHICRYIRYSIYEKSNITADTIF